MVSSKTLLLKCVNIKILFLVVAFVHLACVAVITLSIDTTVDEDPKIREYFYTRWKLLTCWFNLITLGYLPTRLYCEVKSTNSERNGSHVQTLVKITDVVMTSLMTPVTIFADLSFWCMYLVDKSMLAPPGLLEYMPLWAQHSLHTVSFVTILTDLMLIPRSKPRSLKLHTALLMGFMTVYHSMMLYYYMNGIMVYHFLETITFSKYIFMLVVNFGSVLVFFKLQWIVIEARWGKYYKVD